MNSAYLVSLLPVLACPLGMGLMMWLMMRADKHGDVPAARDAAVPSRVAGARPSEPLEALRVQMRDVEAQQAALAAQLVQRGHEAGPSAADDVRAAAALTK